MDKPRANIFQVRKYLNGELDAQAMHRLEREAQDDPFLMDALEGYEMAGKDQQHNLSQLSAQLSSRTAKKERRIIPWATISIAAGVVGFMVVVGLFYKNNNTEQAPLTAQVQSAKPPVGDTDHSGILPPRKETITAVAPIPAATGFRPKTLPVAKPVVIADATVAEPPSSADIAAAPAGNSVTKDDATPMDEMIIGAITKQNDSAQMPLTVAIAKQPISQPLKGKADGVTTSELRASSNAYKLNNLNLPSADAAYLSGIVVNRDGLPMPGVTVKVVGKPLETQTNAMGGYSLPADKGKETLGFSYQGYESKKVSTQSNDSLKVELNENNIALNSVAAVSKGKPMVNKIAIHPAGGWEAFNNYVKKSAVLPPGAKIGIVTLRFVVDSKGAISNIKVIKGLSPIADEQAVSIIRNSGKWTGNIDGNPASVTKTIEFTVQH